MLSSLAFILGFLFLQVEQFFSTMDPAYVDLLKIITGSIGWIGSLTLFMWLREKRKNPSFQLIERDKN